jgi:iron complex outermembrane recepter protein
MPTFAQKTNLHGPSLAGFRKRTPSVLSGCVAASIALYTPLGMSQSRPMLEEVVVTAQKKAESLQDVPLTLQAFSGDSVAEAGITDIEALSENMPAITITRSANSQRIVARGIGSGTNSGFEQSVGTFVDGIYYGRGQQIRPRFIDIASIEVLKGPQSTLFGTNVTAGAINIRSNDPTDEFEGQLSLLVGEDGEQDGNVVVSGPISERLMGRLALYKRDYDGYMDNGSIGDSVAQEDHWGGRIVLLLDASDKLSIRAAYEHHDLEQDGNTAQNVIFAPNFLPEATGDDGKFDYNNEGGLLADFNTIPNGQIADTNKFDTVSIKIDYDGEGYSLTSVSGYTKYDWENIVDSDYTGLNIFAQQTAQEFEQWSQELRLETVVADKLDVLAGVYYHDQDFDQLRTSEVVSTPAGPNLVLSPSKQDTETWALFTQSTLSLTDAARMTVGLRYGSDEKDVYDGLTHSNPVFQSIGFFGAFPHEVNDSRDEDHVSWLVRGEYDFSVDSLAYALVSRGYKAGGFDINGLGSSKGTTPAPDFEFDDERATNYEIGAKLILQDGAATLNGSVFYTEYEDLQVTQFNGAAFELGNAAKAIIQGLEVDYRQALTDELTLSATATWQDFEFKDYLANCNQRQLNGLEGGCVDGAQDLDGKDGQFAPELSANLGIDYVTAVSTNLLFKANLNLVYSDSYYTQLGLDKNARQDSYSKVNARLAIASADERWELAAIGKNLTDEDVSINSFDSAIISDFPLTYVKFITQPRQLALQAIYRF